MKKKIIIIGMDNTGKTTLCKKLSKILNCEILRSVYMNSSKEEILEETIKTLEKKEIIILERFAIFDEIIYGNLLRNYSKFNIDEIKFLKKYDPFIIYCRPNKKVILNFGEREQMKGVIERSDELITCWDDFYKKLKSKKYNIKKYNYKKDNVDLLLKDYYK